MSLTQFHRPIAGTFIVNNQAVGHFYSLTANGGRGAWGDIPAMTPYLALELVDRMDDGARKIFEAHSEFELELMKYEGGKVRAQRLRLIRPIPVFDPQTPCVLLEFTASGYGCIQ
ncbi:hypothetical protein [Acidisoma sp. L85]|uniref:hypothetical protein n=1 Tax=Acidisoma sp. L85 TaxID=1641850 RepID=UPI00131EB17C|nr:hypothetical protein [Acidisoma sp. L85]